MAQLILLLLLVEVSFADCNRMPASEIKAAIEQVAPKHGLKACRMWALVEVETTGGRRVCTRQNTNGTYDTGPFQINSIHKTSTCAGIDIKTLKGNAECAARLLRQAKLYKAIDPMWPARYHSKTPKHKEAYFKKLKPYLEACNG